MNETIVFEELMSHDEIDIEREIKKLNEIKIVSEKTIAQSKETVETLIDMVDKIDKTDVLSIQRTRNSIDRYNDIIDNHNANIDNCEELLVMWRKLLYKDH